MNAARIFVNDADDAIIMTPITDGGSGYYVRLSSARGDIGDEHKRRTYHPSIEFAVERMLWLTDLAGGTFKPAETPNWAESG